MIARFSFQACCRFYGEADTAGNSAKTVRSWFY
jgi:hypothetical protein